MLGPLLFLIYINDLDTEITSRISKFADDTKMGRVIELQGLPSFFLSWVLYIYIYSSNQLQIILYPLYKGI